MDRTLMKGPPIETIFNFIPSYTTRPQTVCETGCLGNPRTHALTCGHYITTRGLEACTLSCQQAAAGVTSRGRILAKAFVCPASKCMKKVAEQEVANIRKTKRDPRVAGLCHVWGLSAAADKKQRAVEDKRMAKLSLRCTVAPSSRLVTPAEAGKMGLGTSSPVGVALLRQVVPVPEMDTDIDSWDLNAVIPQIAQPVHKPVRVTTTALGAKKTVFLDTNEETNQLAHGLAETLVEDQEPALAFGGRSSQGYITNPRSTFEHVLCHRPRRVELSRRQRQRLRNRERREAESNMGYR